MKLLRIDKNGAAEAVRKNDGYCPCKLERNADTKCMCKQFRDQIARQESGECECGLYELQADYDMILAHIDASDIQYTIENLVGDVAVAQGPVYIPTEGVNDDDY